MNIPSWLIAFVIGAAVALWLAARQAAPRAALWLKWLALGSGLAAAGMTAWAGLAWLAPRPAKSAAPTPETQVALTYARLIIPDLAVDAEIRRVPIREGSWDVSRLDEAVGLLAGTGQHPDDNLAMVFIGHVTLPPSAPGPFAGLADLPPVSKIIYRAGNTDYVYAVVESEEIAPEATDQLYVPDGQTLLLVTCTDWDYLTETYLGRLLVRAVFVQTQPAAAQ